MEPRKLGEFLKWVPPAMEVVLDEGVMFAGSKVILYGKYKSMKSMLAQRFMFSCAEGKEWLGFNTPKTGLTVLYLQLEIPEPLLQERLLSMTQGGNIRGIKKEPVIWTEHFLKLDTPQGMTKLERELSRTQPNVVILDPLYKLLSGNIADGHHVSVFLDNVDKLIEKYGISLMILSHSRKPPVKDAEEQTWGSDDLLGTVLLSAWADSIIRVARIGDRELNVSFDVVRHAKREIKPITLEVTQDIEFVKKVRI